jgi:2-dehydro-3-deoxy-D-gluconate 5-dehydrogenase
MPRVTVIAQRRKGQHTMATPTDKAAQQLLDLSGKSAVVTGGAMGIGFGIARRLAGAGASVTIADINPEVGESSCEKLRAEGWTAQFVGGDISVVSDVNNMVEVAVNAYGRLDIWVNNAGVFPGSPILDMSEDLWDRVLDINLKGTFLCSQAAARQMVAEGRGGAIINLSSIDAIRPSFVGLGHYAASKAGILLFTKSLALELAPHRIRVMAIGPGGILTEGVKGSGSIRAAVTAKHAGIPLGRDGEPDDIGRVALFLASDAAAFMTGSMVIVDGGMLLT